MIAERGGAGPALLRLRKRRDRVGSDLAPALAGRRFYPSEDSTERTLLRWSRPVGGAVILALLVWRVGTGPFLVSLHRFDAWSLTAAAVIGLGTTVCCAWRWSLVAEGLGVGVSLPTAVAAYYRSQFLNATLPGGVLGDLHRGLRHGRDVGDKGRALRAVIWERCAGQVVQLVMAMVILILLPSPVRSSMPLVAAAVGVGVLAVVLVGRAVSRGGSFQWSSTMRTAAAEVHHGLLARHLWPGVLVASVVVVVGHVATFLIAARMAGSAASPFRVVPLALLVLLAMSVPTNIAGWGPREGVAAWAFGSAGLTAAQGVTTAVVYGVMVLVANVPGAVVLLAGWVHDHVQGPRTAGVLLSRPHFAETGDHVPRG